MGKLISAALIVKDEENYLDDCLRSMRGLVDEIVVVDTGSTDRTREIAAAEGARLFDYQWHEDFSAARNYALNQATGDWILYIDADERCRPYDRMSLATEIGAADMCACTVRFYPRSGFTAYPEHRLFRRDPRIRFEGAIHETMLPSIQRIVASGASRIGSSNLTLDHIGYDGNQRHKAERNLPLLLKQLQVEPDRIYLWWHLGNVYRDLGRLEEASAAWTQGVDVVRRATIRSHEDALCFIELAKSYQLKGDEALKLVREAARLQPNNLLLDWMKARILVAAGCYGEAISNFARLARIDPNNLVTAVSYDRRILGAWAFAEMGSCAFKMGNYRESEKWYRDAEQMEPDCLEFRVKRQLAAMRFAAANRHSP